MILVNVQGKNVELEFPDGTPDHVIRQTISRDFSTFDPEGGGYDYSTGPQPDASGHYPSLDPKTRQVLKGATHPTWEQTVRIEEQLGNEVVKKEDGRYYSQPILSSLTPWQTLGSDFIEAGGKTVEDLMRPFLGMTYAAAEGLNRGMAGFSQSLDNLSDYVVREYGLEEGGHYDEAVEIYARNAEYWREKVEATGIGAVEKLIGAAVGGGVPGIGEFMLNVPYYALQGAVEADRRGESEALGALKEGAKRKLLHHILGATNVLKQPSRSGAMAGVFGVQAGAEGGSTEEIAHGLGTGALYGLLGGPGKIGLKEVFRPKATPETVWPAGGVPKAEPEFLGKKKPPTKGKAEQKAEGTAKELDLIYNGIQEDAQGKPAAHLFTDRKTGGTFSAPLPSMEAVQKNLDVLRERFGVEQTAKAEPPRPEVDMSQVVLKDMVDAVRTGEKGGYKGQEADGKAVFQKSGYPDWYRDLSKEFGISQKDFLNTMKKAADLKAGEAKRKLGKRQYEVYFKTLEIAKEMSQTGEYAKLSDIDAEAQMAASKGFEYYGPETEVAVGELKPGDKFLREGGEFTHKGFDKKGKAILQNDITLKKDVYDTIELEALKLRGPRTPAVEKAGGLKPTVSEGEGGVSRLTYKNEAGETVGTARLMGSTIGDIEVGKSFQREGHGLSILKDLQERGGQSLIAVTEASVSLAKKAGMEEVAPKTFRFPEKIEKAGEVIKPMEISPVPGMETKPAPEGLSRSKMIKAIEKVLNIPFRHGKFRHKAKGIYKGKEKIVRLKKPGDVETAIHEVAHHLQGLMGLSDRMPAEVQALAYEGAKNVNREGFAEFVRLFVTQETKAKTAAPQFYKGFTEHLKKLPDVQELFVKTRQSWNDWVASPSVSKVSSFIVPGTETKQRKLPTWSEVYSGVKDALYPIKRARDAAAEEGHTFQPKDDPYLLARLTAGWTRKANQYIKWGQFQRDTAQGAVFTGPALKEILRPVEKSGQRHLLDAYLVAKRAMGDKRVEKGFEGILSRGDFEQTVKELAPRFEETAQQLYDYSSSLLEYLVKSGRISEELGKRIKEKNLFYAPLYRVMDFDASGKGLGRNKFGTLHSPIKRLHGSSRDIYSPTESLLYNTYTTINIAERQMVGEALIKLADVEGMGSWIEKVPVKMKKESVDLKDALKQIRASVAMIPSERAVEFTRALDEIAGHNKKVKDLVKKLSDPKVLDQGLEAVEKTIEKAGMEPEDIFLLDQFLSSFRPNYNPGPNEVILYKKSKPHVYELEPGLYKAVSSIEAGNINALIKVLAMPAKLLRAGATTFSPEFGIRNPVRDQMTAFIQSKYGFMPGIDLVRGAFHIFKADELWQRYNASGAAHAHITSIDRDYLSKDLRQVFRENTVGRAIRHPLELVQRLSEFGEEATRVGEFNRALKKEGGDLNALLKSGLAAKEVTIDFSRMGGGTARSINMITAFWNARLEGLDMMVRATKERPVSTTAKAFLSVTLPSILEWYYQKDDQYYNELPGWRRTLFWNFVFHNDDGSLAYILPIPKPFEWGILFGSVPVAALDWAYTEDPDLFKKTGVQLLKTLELLPIPTGVIGPAEWWADKSWFFDRPIVPRSKKDLEPVEQYGVHTSKTVRLVTQMMDKIPGLKEIANPAKIENLLMGYTASFGRLVLWQGDFLIKQFGIGDFPPDPSMTAADVPGLRAFAVRFPSANSRSIEKFYDIYTKRKSSWESKKQRAGVRGLGVKIGVPPELEQDEATARALSTLRKMTIIVNESRTLTPEDKREKLDNLFMGMINVARARLEKPTLGR